MADYDDARFCDMLSYQAVLDDAPRGTNRALIDNCANGAPPYTDDEVETNQIQVNVNDLTMTRALHEARSQFVNGFLKPGNFFRCRTDYGNKHKREDYNTVVTSSVNKPLKKSVPYFESYRSKIGSLVCHGISPAIRENEDKVVPKPLGIGDVLVPSETLLGFENMPRLILRRSFTGIELSKITQQLKRDPGWNMPMVERCMDWLDSETAATGRNYWPQIWAPEKVAERRKENAGWYPTNSAPVINTFDIYFYDTSENSEGWIRRIILDSWGTPTMAGGNFNLSRDGKKNKLEPTKADDFLFTSGDRKVGTTWQNIISFQFADLSSVAPFRYHSVRSLGFLLYSVCHLQNRLRCKFNEALFEQLMMQFRVKSMDDVQRALKLDMVNKGFLDESITPVPAAERWQPRMDMIQLGLNENSQLIAASSGAFAQRRDFSPDRVEKTRFQVMAEVNADTALISSALQQAYQYQAFEDAETFRRMIKPNSSDPIARACRASIIKQGVPEKILIPEAWSVEHERVMGGGNKTQEMSISQQLLEMRPMFDPQPQRKILHDVVLAITDDADKANELVPDMPAVSDSVHDAELSFGPLMQGSRVSPKPGLNAVEVAGTIISLMAGKVKSIMQSGGLGTPQDLMGLQACAQYVTYYINVLSQDKSQQKVSKTFGEALGKLMNEVTGMQQRQQEAAQAAAQQNGNGQDPKDAAKAQAIMLQAQIKSQNAKESHAERTAQKRISFEQKLKQDQEKHAADLRKKAVETKVDVAAEDLKTAAQIRREKMKPQPKPKAPK